MLLLEQELPDYLSKKSYKRLKSLDKFLGYHRLKPKWTVMKAVCFGIFFDRNKPGDEANLKGGRYS